MDAQVKQFLADLKESSPTQYKIVTVIQKLYRKYGPHLAVEMKYGGIVYLHEGTLISGIFVYKEHLSIEFSQGVNLPDPANDLEGKGKLRRHLKIKSLEELAEKNAKKHVENVIALAS